MTVLELDEIIKQVREAKYKIGDRVRYKDGDKGIIVNGRQGGDLWRVYNASKDKLENWHESYFSLEKLEG